MKLRKLLKNVSQVQLKGPKEVEITGVCEHSRVVAPGNLFVAKKGSVDDGAKYIEEALAAGAAAILTDLYDPFLPKEITQVIAADIPSVEAEIVSQFYGNPSQELTVIGVTGTNGKTTTTFMIRHLLNRLRGHCGLIGTIEYLIGEHRYAAARTTPDVCTIHRLLREMVHQGCRSAVLEVSSHALMQGRVDNVAFDGAVFTNLTPDHLDYHGTMEEYCNAKKKLFLKLGEKKTSFGIFNRDCEWSARMREGVTVPCATYGLQGQADLTAEEIRMDAKGTRCEVRFKEQRAALMLPLIGAYNLSNAMAAIAVGVELGYSLAEVVAALSDCPSIPGRLEKVPNPLGIPIFVDFAHSPDSLQKVCEAVKPLTQGKLILVFGCGGDRDRQKRPEMARMAESFADQIIVTSDNPRSEEPQAIMSEIQKGFTSDAHMIAIEKREEAIHHAIGLATQEDVILICGKGHEQYQIFAHKTVPFDDRLVAQEACERLMTARV